MFRGGKLFKNLLYLIIGLSMAKWTGSPVFYTLWLYVLGLKIERVLSYLRLCIFLPMQLSCT
jgi:hypothetical protein